MVLTDLHLLCAQTDHTQKHWGKLLHHLQSHRHEAAEEEDEGKLPLHYILMHRAPLTVVQALVQVYPEALYCRQSSNGFLPLHVAIATCCDVDVIEYLLKSNPDATRMRTHRDFLCCIQEYLLLCRGKHLRGFTSVELAERCLKENPNRKRIVEMLQSYQGT